MEALLHRELDLARPRGAHRIETLERDTVEDLLVAGQVVGRRLVKDLAEATSGRVAAVVDVLDQAPEGLLVGIWLVGVLERLGRARLGRRSRRGGDRRWRRRRPSRAGDAKREEEEGRKVSCSHRLASCTAGSPASSTVAQNSFPLERPVAFFDERQDGRGKASTTSGGPTWPTPCRSSATWVGPGGDQMDVVHPGWPPWAARMTRDPWHAKTPSRPTTAIPIRPNGGHRRSSGSERPVWSSSSPSRRIAPDGRPTAMMWPTPSGSSAGVAGQALTPATQKRGTQERAWRAFGGTADGPTRAYTEGGRSGRRTPRGVSVTRESAEPSAAADRSALMAGGLVRGRYRQRSQVGR